MSRNEERTVITIGMRFISAIGEVWEVHKHNGKIGPTRDVWMCKIVNKNGSITTSNKYPYYVAWTFDEDESRRVEETPPEVVQVGVGSISGVPKWWPNGPVPTEYFERYNLKYAATRCPRNASDTEWIR